MTYPSGYVVNYNYGAGGGGSLDETISRLTSLSDASGTLESYTYLGLGTIVQRSNPASTLTYIDQGDSLANHDGGDRYTGLDRFGRVIDQWWLNTADLSESTPIITTADRFQYGYDRDSNRLSKSNLLDTALSETYSYDNLNRLISMTRGGAAYQSWNLDGLGNMDSVTTGGTTEDRTHNSQNELTSVGSNTLTFDANGNTTTDDQGHTLVYDAWNRLVSVKNGSTILETYAYDATGRRITETDATATTTTLFYSSQWQVLETQQSGQTTARYVWSPVYVNALICRDQPTTPGGALDQRVYVQQDANFNVTALLTYNTGTSTWAVALRIAYDSYGNATFYTAGGTPTTNTLSFRVLYQGGWFDSATGLYVFQRRDYSPTMMRWMQQDPMGYVDGANRFAALSDNPMSRADAVGLKAIVVAFGGLGGNDPIANWKNIAKEANPGNVDYQEFEWLQDGTAFDRTIKELENPIPGRDDCIYNSLVVLGHSFGGDAAHKYIDRLRAKKIGVDQVVTADPRHFPGVFPLDILPFNKPKNVFEWQNFYQTQQLLPPPEFFGAEVHGFGAVNTHLTLSDPQTAHIDITKAKAVTDAISRAVKWAEAGRRLDVVRRWL